MERTVFYVITVHDRQWFKHTVATTFHQCSSCSSNSTVGGDIESGGGALSNALSSRFSLRLLYGWLAASLVVRAMLTKFFLRKLEHSVSFWKYCRQEILGITSFAFNKFRLETNKQKSCRAKVQLHIYGYAVKLEYKKFPFNKFLPTTS